MENQEDRPLDSIRIYEAGTGTGTEGLPVTRGKRSLSVFQDNSNEQEIQQGKEYDQLTITNVNSINPALRPQHEIRMQPPQNNSNKTSPSPFQEGLSLIGALGQPPSASASASTLSEGIGGNVSNVPFSQSQIQTQALPATDNKKAAQVPSASVNGNALQVEPSPNVAVAAAATAHLAPEQASAYHQQLHAVSQNHDASTSTNAAATSYLAPTPSSIYQGIGLLPLTSTLQQNNFNPAIPNQVNTQTHTGVMPTPTGGNSLLASTTGTFPSADAPCTTANTNTISLTKSPDPQAHHNNAQHQAQHDALTALQQVTAPSSYQQHLAVMRQHTHQQNVQNALGAQQQSLQAPAATASQLPIGDSAAMQQIMLANFIQQASGLQTNATSGPHTAQSILASHTNSAAANQLWLTSSLFPQVQSGAHHSQTNSVSALRNIDNGAVSDLAPTNHQQTAASLASKLQYGNNAVAMQLQTGNDLLLNNNKGAAAASVFNNHQRAPHQQHHHSMINHHGFEQTMVPSPPIPCTTLYLHCDHERLSEYQILVRKQLEVHEAEVEDVDADTQGRKKQVYMGQVGLRCRHCSSLPLRLRGKGSVYFPQILRGLYQAAQNMAATHLRGSCPCIPPPVRLELERLTRLKDKASGGKQYWADGGRALGMHETEDGISMRKDIDSES